MAIKRISQIGENVIRAKAKPITAKEKSAILKLIRDMRDSMIAMELVGIAAPQVGVSKQVFLSEVRRTALRKKIKDLDPLRVFINPRITWRSTKETVMMEGCGSLSHASLFGPVKRPAAVEVRALDENFKPFTLKAKGLLAKIIQHEYDHLQGIVILDKFTNTRKCWVRETK